MVADFNTLSLYGLETHPPRAASKEHAIYRRLKIPIPYPSIGNPSNFRASGLAGNGGQDCAILLHLVGAVVGAVIGQNGAAPWTLFSSYIWNKPQPHFPNWSRPQIFVEPRDQTSNPLWSRNIGTETRPVKIN